MASDPLILGFDTSAAHCAAALLRGEEVLDSRVLEMTRGQAEELMPLLEVLLAEQNLNWRDLSAIGVGTGPGNFTGIRISVSAARGLALALEVPCIGVSTFDATLHGTPTPVAAAVPAPRDQQYVQEPGEAAKLVSLPYDTDLPVVHPPSGAILAENIAHQARLRMDDNAQRPAPLYIRQADAAPSRDLPPKIL